MKIKDKESTHEGTFLKVSKEELKRELRSVYMEAIEQELDDREVVGLKERVELLQSAKEMADKVVEQRTKNL